MSTDELYYKRYTELSEVALRAYYDYSILIPHFYKYFFNKTNPFFI